MLESIYVGLTGLDSYSKGLNVISNNVANLNTPGFKGSQLQFADLYYKDGDGGMGSELPRQVGAGVQTGGTFLNFQQGEARDTGNDLDAMIDGAGLFLLRQDGHQIFSRAGQFQIDASGFLVDKSGGGRLAARDPGGALSDINVTGFRFSPAKVSSQVKLAGNLSSADTQHVISSLTVYDSSGAPRAIKLTFDNTNTTTPGSWKVTAALEDGTVIPSTGELRFKDGKPVEGYTSVALSYRPAGAASLDLVLDVATDVTSTLRAQTPPWRCKHKMAGLQALCSKARSMPMAILC
jgi:flagellar hook protein FlgE